ncbi:uncharacterized protein [Anabrus simplex]|uniref:uncharacterized protein n=1 Tax=Anabrus simplex TaxID=316456 RepID=UPI0034DD1383
MTVMLLQHSPLQHYKPPSSTTATAPPTTTEKEKSSTTSAAPPPRPPPKVRPQINLLTSHHIVSPSKHRMSCNAKAMRYYRLWIYTCNAVLLLSVLGFAIVAGKIVVADPRRYLVPGLSLYQPSFLYAYLALATQSGLLQVVGCLGALRLNERLLNVYWLLLLVLLFGDAIVGIVWVFRFDKICSDLRPTLKQRLAAEYGVDADFTTLWDALQRDYQCCGVDGAQDFSGVVVTVNRTGVVGSTATNDQIHATGCKDSLLLWLRQSADVLFVLGYCVIAFLKLCFVGILRYEIKEMIQKIKILQGEMRPPQLSLTELGGANSPTLHSPGGGASNTPHLQPLLMNHHENSNGGLVSVQVGTTGGSHQSPPTGTGGNALLLLQPPDSLQTTPLHVSTAAQRHLNLLNDGTDSDTNSNCALIISEDTGKPTRTKQPRGSNGNNNYEIHELQELNRLLSRHQTQI